MERRKPFCCVSYGDLSLLLLIAANLQHLLKSLTIAMAMLCRLTSGTGATASDATPAANTITTPAISKGAPTTATAQPVVQQSS